MSDTIRIPIQVTALEQVSGVFLQRSMQAHFDLTPEIARQIVALAGLISYDEAGDAILPPAPQAQKE